VRLFGHIPPPGQAVIIKPLQFSPIPYMVVTMPDPMLLPGQTVVDQKPRSGYRVVVGRFWTVHGRVVRREIVADERRGPRNEIVRVAVPPTVQSPEPTPAQAPTLPPLFTEPQQRVQREGEEINQRAGARPTPTLPVSGGVANLFAGVGPR